MAYGLQIFDASGNITLDTTDETLKDVGLYSSSSITTAGQINLAPVPPDAEVLVTNNTGDVSSAGFKPLPEVELDRINYKLNITGANFDIGVRVLLL